MKNIVHVTDNIAFVEAELIEISATDKTTHFSKAF